MPVSPPFDVDITSPGNSDLVSAYPPDERLSRDVLESWLTFISDPATGLLKASAATNIIAGVSPFPSGTRMPFIQTTPPTGWTKVTDAAYNDAALRIVTGSVLPTGGTVAFTTAFASQGVSGTVGSTVLTAANMPTHTHTFSDTASTGTDSVNHTHTQQGTFGSTTNGAHTHTEEGNAISASPTGGGSAAAESETNNTSSAGNHTHTTTISGATTGVSALHTHSVTVSGTTSSAGSSTGHTHTFTGTAINIDVKHVDAIVATKD